MNISMTSPTNTAASRIHGRIQLFKDVGSRPSNGQKRLAEPVGPSCDSTTSSNHQRRRRTVLACDGRRPRCSFCLQHDSPCIYQRAAAPAPSKLELEVSTIRESLDHITHLLSYRTEKRHAPSSPVLGADAEDVPPEQEPTSDFPFMTRGTRSMMIIIGVDKDLADFLIHTWYPIFHPGFSDQFFQSITGSFHNSTDCCLVLLVAAIGSLAESDSVMAALEARPYIESALAMLPTVLGECSLRSLQCLVLFSVYYYCFVKLCQAHDYALMASFKAQNILKCQLYVDNAEKLEFVRRTFWATLLIESELSVHFDLAESGIWKLDSHIPLRDSHETWNIATTASPVLPTSPESHHFIYAPIIAAELELQLEQWHAVLPDHLRFGQPDSDDRTESAAAGFLQAQYYSCKASIYWPAVHQAIESSEADSDLLPHCRKCFDSYIKFHALTALRVLILEQYIHFSMAALKAASTPCLRSTKPSPVAQCFELANETFQSMILNERVSTWHMARN
ncbi:hypothetical protein V1527DRAFT_522356 [Lipomyces starkeyi]